MAAIIHPIGVPSIAAPSTRTAVVTMLITGPNALKAPNTGPITPLRTLKAVVMPFNATGTPISPIST